LSNTPIRLSRIETVTAVIISTVPSDHYELRAAMSMARLWRDQGKRDEARELLAPVYGWFTEGFETLDLKEAKVLLGELAG
jgi:predicted ATPase